MSFRNKYDLKSNGKNGTSYKNALVRLCSLIMVVVLMFGISSCNLPEPTPSPTYTATYIAGDGGHIVGKAIQEITEGKDTAEVEAVANDGYTFVEWSDGIETATRTDKNVTENFTVTALFAPIPPEKETFTLTYLAGDGGRIAGDTAQYVKEGENAQEVEAVANDGYTFVEWSDGIKTAKRTDKNVTKNLTVTALFELIPPEKETFTLTYVASTGGRIVGNAVQNVTEGDNGKEVEAVANEGYTFVEWSDGIKTAKRTDKNVTKNLTVTAIFEPIPKQTFTLTYLAGAGGRIVGNAVQNVTEGDNAEEVEAVANEGYTFVEWSDGIKTAKRADKNITANYTVTALFELIPTGEIGLPVFRITTDDGQGIYSKDVYKTCKISVSNAEAKYCFENASANIRGRGNSSWDWPKKPYKIKFDSKIDLFGNGKAKKWTLIANYTDYSLVRNYMVYSLGQEFEALSETTTTTQFVEVYLNGRYDGVYLVCEQVETGSNRVDVEDDLEKFTDPNELGFLIELDKRVRDYNPPSGSTFVYDGDYYFRLSNNYRYFDEDTPFTIKSPDSDDAADLGLDFNVYVNYIRLYMDNALEVLWSGNYNAVKEQFDVQSWAEGYIIDELFKNVDVVYSSFYMFKDNKDGKLYRGPLWDYDISSDNCNYYNPVNNANGIYATRNSIYKKLLEYTEFRALVVNILNEKAAKINMTLDNCVNYVFARSDAFERNFERWPLLNWGRHEGWIPVPDHLRSIPTWQEHVTHLRNWLNDSLNYMLSQYRL